MPVLRTVWDATLEVAPDRAAAIDDGRRVGYERRQELAELWEACGLLEVAVGERLVHADYESFDDLSGHSRPEPDTPVPVTRPSTKPVSDASGQRRTDGSASRTGPSPLRLGRGGYAGSPRLERFRAGAGPARLTAPSASS